jgi:hypothetical protein
MSSFRPYLLSIALALLLLPAAMADSCDDCLRAVSDCCPASCCPCCTAGFSALISVVRLDMGPVAGGVAGDPPVGHRLSAPPRDVFHVPKLPLG